jgi:DNA-binding response OmpR family regulator
METLIVVDDDEVFSGLIKTVFEFEGYEVVLVPRPGDVVLKAREVRPVLLLMDVHSEGGDTLGVLRELRADETLKAMPVVMTSGMDRADECLAAGATDFILKPFRPDELIDLVKSLVAE